MNLFKRYVVMPVFEDEDFGSLEDYSKSFVFKSNAQRFFLKESTKRITQGDDLWYWVIIDKKTNTRI